MRALLSFFLKKSKRRAGFTLLEIIVVVSITIVLSTIVLAYSRSNEKQIILYREQAMIVGLINQAKTLAIQKFNEPGTGFTACAFGIHFSGQSNYSLYEVGTSSSVCGSLPTYNYDLTNSAVLIRTIQNLTLDPSLVFKLSASNVDVGFISPSLTVTSNQPLPVTISLSAADGTTASIQVGYAGQIVTK